jgi:hypothetical protein
LGNHVSEFTVGEQIIIQGSTGNDGYYTVTDVAPDGFNTVVAVAEDIPVDGSTYGSLIRMIEVDCDSGVFYTTVAGGIYFYWDSGELIWKRLSGEILTITAAGDTDLSEFNIIVTADIPTGTFGIIEISLDGGSNWNIMNTIGYTKAQLLSGVALDAGGQDFMIRIHTKTLNCDYGRTPAIGVILALRAIIPYTAVEYCLPPPVGGVSLVSARYLQWGSNPPPSYCDLTSGGDIALDDDAALLSALTACFGGSPPLHGVVDDTGNGLMIVEIYDDIFTAGRVWTIDYESTWSDATVCTASATFVSVAIY